MAGLRACTGRKRIAANLKSHKYFIAFFPTLCGLHTRSQITFLFALVGVDASVANILYIFFLHFIILTFKSCVSCSCAYITCLTTRSGKKLRNYGLGWLLAKKAFLNYAENSQLDDFTVRLAFRNFFNSNKKIVIILFLSKFINFNHVVLG